MNRGWISNPVFIGGLMKIDHKKLLEVFGLSEEYGNSPLTPEDGYLIHDSGLEEYDYHLVFYDRTLDWYIWKFEYIDTILDVRMYDGRFHGYELSGGIIDELINNESLMVFDMRMRKIRDNDDDMDDGSRGEKFNVAEEALSYMEYDEEDDTLSVDRSDIMKRNEIPRFHDFSELIIWNGLLDTSRNYNDNSGDYTWSTATDLNIIVKAELGPSSYVDVFRKNNPSEKLISLEAEGDRDVVIEFIEKYLDEGFVED